MSNTNPFHKGEQAIQRRYGVAERMGEIGARVIRDFMPDQHRAFFAQLPYILLSVVGDDGWPRASFLTGQPGFVQSPDARTLVIEADLARDPNRAALRAGALIGGLGIELHTRRRNRFTAHIAKIEGGKITLAIDHSFGNCPQYIQTRHVQNTASAPDHHETEHLGQLDEAASALVSRADTFFIATAAPLSADKVRHGADVSHRGGKAGFVRVDDARHLTIPDFGGNRFFNTLGNLHLNERAGLLFIDFGSGDLLQISSRIKIDFDSEEIGHFAGAERLLRAEIDHAVRIEGGAGLRFDFGEYSPRSLATGAWG